MTYKYALYCYNEDGDRIIVSIEYLWADLAKAVETARQQSPIVKGVIDITTGITYRT